MRMHNQRNVRTFRTDRPKAKRLRKGMRVRIHSDVRYAFYPVVKENVGNVGKLLDVGRDWCLVELPNWDSIDVPTSCVRAL